MQTSSDSDIVVACDQLGKAYRIYPRPHDRLKQAIVPRLLNFALPFSRRTPPTYFKEFWALRNVSFELRRGETFGIIGRNGSGKSTLLQMICGTVAPTLGSVRTTGRISALLELGAGFNPEFTGAENVYLYASLLGMTAGEIDARFDDIAAFADIGEFIGQPVKAYSSGMYVRLAFAVAVHVDPEILIVDEALSVGDFAFQSKCARRMRQYLDDGGTLLFVSHDIGAVKSLCDRAIYLRRGELRDIGTTERVVQRYLEEVNEEEGLAQKPTVQPSGVHPESESRFKASVAPFRRHSSDHCEFVSVEVLNKQDLPVSLAGWGETLKVRAVLHVLRRVDKLTVAFYLRDRLQVDLMGTNSTYEGCQLNDLQPDERVEIQFEFQNFLQAGEYGVCLIAADQPITTQQFFDWIDLAASFRSADRPGQKAWAIFNPGIRVLAERRIGVRA